LVSVNFAQRATVPDHVLFRDLDGEAVVLDLNGGQYYGLDEVGTRMWTLVTTQPSIEAACLMLLAEYDVDELRLRHDLDKLVCRLVDQGLLRLADAS
jgi:hypothetical protein